MAHYDFLFPKLRGSPWTPRGTSPAEQVDEIRSRALALYGPTVDGGFAAAYTFFGQFVTHDVTFDARTGPADGALDFPNHRTPGFDLDCVYAGGPRSDPHLYEQRDPRKLWIGSNANGEPDLPRNRDSSLDSAATRAMNRRRVALVADPRNDDNIVVSQLHLAFLRFHNRLVAQGAGFAEAQRLTRLHYQWVLYHDFLAKLCTPALLDGVRKLPDPQRLFPRTQPARVPFEFAFAAFRFGHSMVGPRYFLNDALADDGIPPFPLYDFYATDWISRDANASKLLDGQRVLPPRWTVQWELFLPGSHPRAQRAQQIDMRIDGALRQLPMPMNRDLAFRTLLRGWLLGLPSGQSVARHLGETPLLSDHKNDDPLWIYVLREAEGIAVRKTAAAVKVATAPSATHTGNALGPVGARIVAEVCVRLLEEDPDSILCGNPEWTPEAVKQGGSYTLREFLVDAGAPITRADWDAAVPPRSQRAK